jgi:hypothetical protein
MNDDKFDFSMFETDSADPTESERIKARAAAIRRIIAKQEREKIEKELLEEQSKVLGVGDALDGLAKVMVGIFTTLFALVLCVGTFWLLGAIVMSAF